AGVPGPAHGGDQGVPVPDRPASRTPPGPSRGPGGAVHFGGRALLPRRRPARSSRRLSRGAAGGGAGAPARRRGRGGRPRGGGVAGGAGAGGPAGEGAWHRPATAAAIRATSDRAKALRAEGKTAEADAIWNALEALYRDDPDAGEIREQIRKDRGT